VTVSRRGVLGLAAVALGAGVAACTRSSRTITTGSSTSHAPAATGTVLPTAAPTRSAPATVAPTRPAVAAPKGPAVEYAHGSRTGSSVALTFHGAGDPDIARQLLAILAARHASVTVMAVGTWVAENRAVARAIAAGGHELGNHTYSHLDINSLPRDAARAEITRCRDVLQATVGSAGALFRPSQAQNASPLVRQLAGAAGYRVCLSYDIDSLDYTDPGPAAIRRAVATARAGSIVSLHFGHPGTVTALPMILDDLASRGLTPVAASHLLPA
jgi:peptidoglycan/xylan/chitin deacetylase (PgdA/CDA1 family)